MALAARRGNVFFQVNIQHMLIEENQGIERLSLRRSRHLFFCSEMGKERFDIFCAEKPRMRFTAEVVDITKNPLTIGLLCAISVVVISKDLSNLVHQFEIRIGTELQLIVFHGFPLISQ